MWLLCIAGLVRGQDALDSPDTPIAVDTATLCQRYLQAETFRLFLRTDAELAQIDEDNWPRTQDRWRAELRVMLGLDPLPPTTDLKTTVTRTQKLEGVEVRNLHYQASPGLYVAANLYVPDTEVPEGGWPAVLYVCGHARVEEAGRLLGNKTAYHHHGLWLARHGMVCLTIDTIQLGELHGEHHGTNRLNRWDWNSRGYTPAGVETWNAIRAIDLLQSLPEVDGERIAITGRSGGGAYSWFAAALDDRIRVAVPVAGITDLRNHVIDQAVGGHCDCMYFANFFGWDYGKLAALVAPRPLLLANSDNDSIFPLDGVLRIHTQLAGIYESLGAGSNLGLLLTPGAHQDTQELQVGAFRWITRHLSGEPITVDSAALKQIAAEDLRVFGLEIPRNQRVTSAAQWFTAQGTLGSAISDSARRWQALEQIAKGGSGETLRNVDYLDRLFRAASSTQSFERMVVSATEHATEERAIIEGLPVGLLQINRDPRPRDEGSKSPVIVLADSSLWRAALATAADPTDTTSDIGWRLIRERFATRPMTVVAPLGSGSAEIGLEGKPLLNLVRSFNLLGQSIDSARLESLLRVISSQIGALGTSSPAADSVDLVGVGREADLVMLATLLHPAVGVGYVGGLSNEPTLTASLPGLLQIGDFETLRERLEKSGRIQWLDVPHERKVAGDDWHRPLTGPHQTTGIRILEVHQDRATVWARTTRYSLATLEDRPPLRFELPAASGKQNQRPILPEDGVAGLPFAVPGIEGELRVRFRTGRSAWQFTPWRLTAGDTDWSERFELTGLIPATQYDIQVEARPVGSDGNPTSTNSGSFKTLPKAESESDFRLAVSTCQEFEDRDGPFGFELYRTISSRDTDAFIHAGDVVYYDAKARSVELAHFHWQRTYCLRTLVQFHRSMPSYFLKDDHDTYVNDSWPGQYHAWTEAFRFEDGQRIFKEQTALPDPAYRTIRLGRHLQVWMLEGRDYRVANDLPDGPEKTIWGEAQWDWLRDTFAASDATHRVVVSPTPIVGPDRPRKNDNLSNQGFSHEGRLAREFLGGWPNTHVVCGDRHWQYHSIDPATGLHEFSVGPASDRHAGGWNPDEFQEGVHQFLRVGGGYLEIDLTHTDGEPSLTFRHLDTQGNLMHEHLTSRPNAPTVEADD